MAGYATLWCDHGYSWKGHAGLGRGGAEWWWYIDEEADLEL